jgi:hypothetical protein
VPPDVSLTLPSTDGESPPLWNKENSSGSLVAVSPGETAAIVSLTEGQAPVAVKTVPAQIHDLAKLAAHGLHWVPEECLRPSRIEKSVCLSPSDDRGMTRKVKDTRLERGLSCFCHMSTARAGISCVHAQRASPDSSSTLRGSRRSSSVRSASLFENCITQLEPRLTDAIVSPNTA